MAGLRAHGLSIESPFIVDGYTPHCDCGWMGAVHSTQKQAIEQWDNHSATEPTGGDS